jgi:glutamine cyclotransferase
MTTIADATTNRQNTQKPKTAEIVRELGPFGANVPVHGVTHDGRHLFFASGEALCEVDPEKGEIVRKLAVGSDAGTAFDGKHLYQIGDAKIQKIDPQTGRVVATIPAPAQGRDSGLCWAEGKLFVGEYRARKIHQIDPETGKIERTIESDRFVTGVTFVDGELWHGTWEGEQSDLRRVDPESGEVLERLAMPPGVGVSGVEADRNGLLWCGGGESGKIRAVRRRKSR